MTAVDKLPDYNGEPVTRMQIKTVGAGTGFTGLDVAPIIMDLDDEMYAVVKLRAAESPTHLRKKGDLVRMQRLHIDEMAPVSDEIATAALREYAAEIQRLKSEMDGQLALDDEAAALDREARDDLDSPAEIAAAAAARVWG